MSLLYRDATICEDAHFGFGVHWSSFWEQSFYDSHVTFSSGSMKTNCTVLRINMNNSIQFEFIYEFGAQVTKANKRYQITKQRKKTRCNIHHTSNNRNVRKTSMVLVYFDRKRSSGWLERGLLESFSGFQSPRWPFSMKVCYSCVQTIFLFMLLLSTSLSSLSSSLCQDPKRIWGNKISTPIGQSSQPQKFICVKRVL